MRSSVLLSEFSADILHPAIFEKVTDSVLSYEDGCVGIESTKGLAWRALRLFRLRTSLKRGTLSLSLLVLVLLALILVPFLIWGAEFDRVLSLEGVRKWMEQYGRWAWLAGMGLVPGRAPRGRVRWLMARHVFSVTVGSNTRMFSRLKVTSP